MDQIASDAPFFSQPLAWILLVLVVIVALAMIIVLMRLLRPAPPAISETTAAAGKVRSEIKKRSVKSKGLFTGSRSAKPLPITIEKVHIKDFKNIKDLVIDLTAEEFLGGNWTCIAGINGAGKSSILQAICILLLGEHLVRDLQTKRLRRMLRRDESVTHDARLEAQVRIGTEGPSIKLLMPLSEDGVNESELRSDENYEDMLQLWEYLEQTVVVSYGATRNLSDQVDSRHDESDDQVRRQMTLFDPLTRIAGVDLLLEGRKRKEDHERKIETLRRLLKIVVGDSQTSDNTRSDLLNARLSRTKDTLVFTQAGAEIEAIDLPDGFRTTVAWLTDLCCAWHDTTPEGKVRSTDPADITGIALIDEIALHLHPSMARSIVPQLREALPKVQFIATTHSPLILSSFHRDELRILLAEKDGTVGLKELDRQVFGFSMDEIYVWLMGANPTSAVIERKINEGDDPDLSSYLFQSDEVSEQEAKVMVDEMEQLLDKYRDD